MELCHALGKGVGLVAMLWTLLSGLRASCFT
jgi:hypothetical protein